MSISQPSSFSERQAAYAAWKDRLREDKAGQKVIDLTEDEEPAVDPWSTEALFAESRRAAAEEEGRADQAG